jgi:hypothetical protein
VIHLSLDTNEQNPSSVPQILNLLLQFSLYFIKQPFFCKFLKIEIYFFSLNGMMFIITTFIYICISNTLIRHFKGTFKFYYTQLYIFFYDDVCFVLDQHVQLDFYSAISLKQQFACRQVNSLCSYSLIKGCLCSYSLIKGCLCSYSLIKGCLCSYSLIKGCILNREAANNNLIVFGLTGTQTHQYFFTCLKQFPVPFLIHDLSWGL